MSERIRQLPMYGIDTQRKTRGGINSSSTHIDQTGTLDAVVALSNDVINDWKAQPIRNISETDDLNVPALARAVEQRLVGHPDLGEPTSSVQELTDSHLRLKQLRAKKPSKMLRDVEAIVMDVIGEPIERLRKALDDVAGQAPHKISDLVATVQGVLDSIELPEPNGEPTTVLGRIIRALNELDQRRSGLPAKSVQFALQRLAERAIPEWSHSIASLAQEVVVEALKKELVKLRGLLTELLGRGHLFTKNLEVSQSKLDAWRSETAKASHVSKASVVLELPGPDESAVVAGIMTRLNCKDRRELGGVLRAKWESALRAKALGWVPADAPLGMLLTYCDPAVIAETFRETVESSLGEGHSVYEIIERAGLKRSAQDLFDRAEHLCHLRSRDIEQFNVNPQRVGIVRFPPPIGPRDAHIREQLALEFQQLGATALVEASPAERHAITVVRMYVGWPIGIEGGCPALLLEYARAHESGHLPHLVGILDGSPVGAALPEYLELAQHLRPDA